MIHLALNDRIQEMSDEEVGMLYHALPGWRREVADKYKHKGSRRECIVAFSLLQQLLREYCGIEDVPPFSFNEHGKPFLSQYPDIHFNISHCKNAVVAALSDEEVGVDVEAIGRYKEQLAAYCMNADECRMMESSDNPDLEFTRLWTMKEAVAKLVGTGITDDIKEMLTKYKDINTNTEQNVAKGYVLTIANN